MVQNLHQKKKLSRCNSVGLLQLFYFAPETEISFKEERFNWIRAVHSYFNLVSRELKYPVINSKAFAKM
jgi:hypothetical protein